MSARRFLISGEDVTESINQAVIRLGLSQKTMERCSGLLTIQLYATISSGVENVFKIISEINNLENCPHNSRTKPATLFRGKELGGLWHKHYEGSSIQDLARNLQNQFRLNERTKGSGLPDLAARIEENEKTGAKQYFEVEDIPAIAHEFAITNFMRRSDAKQMTGHWIIYALYKNENYYLTIGRHDESDEAIRDRIDAICIDEFPFLKDILTKRI